VELELGIEITYLSLGFGDENFSFSFYVIDKLAPGILLGMGFILKYHCVPYLSKAIFTLANGQISVPIGENRSGSRLAKLRENFNFKRRPRFRRFRGRKLHNKPDNCFEPSPDTNVGLILSISHDHNHTAVTQTAAWTKTRPTDLRNRHGRLGINRLRTTSTMLQPKNNTFYSKNKRFISSITAHSRANRGNNFASHTNGRGDSNRDYLSPLPLPIHKVVGRWNRRDSTHVTVNNRDNHDLDNTVCFGRGEPFGPNGLVRTVRLDEDCMGSEGRQVSLDPAGMSNSLIQTSSGRKRGWCHVGNGMGAQTGPVLLDTATKSSRVVHTVKVESMTQGFSRPDRFGHASDVA